MEYICKDRGSASCPCPLIETGQCYTCGMAKSGRCDCPPGWQGVCPFTEYYQNGKKIVSRNDEKRLFIKEYKEYSDKHKLIVLKTPSGFALKCKEMGTFLMVRAGDFYLPLSVMQSCVAEGSGFVYISFYIAGPKTKILDERCREGGTLCVKGPFFNGLINSENFHYGKATMVVAKGMAAMPFINQWERLKNTLTKLYIDTDKLADGFIEEQLGNMDYENINLYKDWQRLSAEMEMFQREGGNVLLMASPYYVKMFSKRLSHPVIYPNHSNMCCGAGMCGACSRTDMDGTTVKLCKCNGEIKKEA